VGLRLHDGAAGRQIIGGRAGGSSNDDAVATAFHGLHAIAFHAQVDDACHSALGDHHVIEAHFVENEPKGEFVVVVAGADKPEKEGRKNRYPKQEEAEE
jgi:hypothetical protein